MNLASFQNRKLTPEQEAYGKDKENMTNLVEIVKAVKPTVALGELRKKLFVCVFCFVLCFLRAHWSACGKSHRTMFSL